ncbi:MAG: hypothetical protein CBB68_15285 [Rhodospirillaceae bacterium TMED8]|nr:hypothetical protein [Magnetovibrio sp.]OUT47789.1 MAG: hypothetical protein CBB68_15285 [Rhodospirillaceae bacterium TMED8]|tara:strand:- start:1968 stop:3083 length:1116 start_codon:yes stop_codon:yes gene_type:complete
MELKDASLALVKAFKHLFVGMMDSCALFLSVVPTWILVVSLFLAAVSIGIVVGLVIGRFLKAHKKRALGPESPKIDKMPISPENPATIAYREFVASSDPASRQADDTTQNFANTLKDLRQKLAEAARNAIKEDKFEDALAMLMILSNDEGQDGIKALNAGHKHLMAATLAKSISGELYIALLDPESAMQQFSDAIELLPDNQEQMLMGLHDQHARAAYQAGNHINAIHSFETALKLMGEILGQNHPTVAKTISSLARVYYSCGDYERTEKLYRQALRINEEALGKDHPSVSTDLNNLALLHKREGYLEIAEPLLKRSLEILDKTVSLRDPHLVATLRNYASVLKGLGRDHEAIPFEKRANAESLLSTPTNK